ncbi:hypothetical protein DH2020_005339 [Rehmannia glutinosa]|uniref:Cytochrome P450 protein n=1 Tax=Rehmannia glutinosa TaxID=99300 RepID=A0ABR0XFM9_REHGL
MNAYIDEPVQFVLVSTIIILSISWILLLLATKNSSNKKNPPLPPGPKGLPLVGNLLSLDPDLHTYFTNLAQTYGPIYTLKLGKKTGIVVTSPAVAKQVLKDHDTIFANRDVPVAGKEATYGGSDIVWNPYGPEWRMLRKVCVREMLSNNTLDTVYDLRRREIRGTIRYLYSRAGSTVDIGEQMFLTRFDLQGIQGKMKGLAKRFDKIFESIIEQRLKITDGKESKDFLQFLLQMKDNNGDAKTPFTMTHLKALLMGARVFVNVWAIHRDPTIWEKPLEFCPERFLDGKWDYNGNDFNYFPFGSGRRICAGTAMAERMFMFSLASLVHSFDWSLPVGETLDLSEKFGIVLKKKMPLIAIPTPRLSNPSLYD